MNTEVAQSIAEKKRQSNNHAYAMQESKAGLLVKFDPRLGFFTPPKEGYRNRVRQVLDAI
jgi:hypothetical protein